MLFQSSYSFRHEKCFLFNLSTIPFICASASFKNPNSWEHFFGSRKTNPFRFSPSSAFRLFHRTRRALSSSPSILSKSRTPAAENQPHSAPHPITFSIKKRTGGKILIMWSACVFPTNDHFSISRITRIPQFFFFWRSELVAPTRPLLYISLHVHPQMPRLQAPQLSFPSSPPPIPIPLFQSPPPLHLLSPPPLLLSHQTLTSSRFWGGWEVLGVSASA